LPVPPLAEVGVQLASPVASFVPQPVKHAVVLEQMRLPAQGPPLPLPLHVPPLQAVKVLVIALAHVVAEQEVEVPGYEQAPVPSQSVAPQAPPVMQAAEQQCPVPVAPQMVDVHWSPEVHAAPAASLGTQAPLPLQ
jgi:hypothetical protein